MAFTIRNTDGLHLVETRLYIMLKLSWMIRCEMLAVPCFLGFHPTDIFFYLFFSFFMFSGLFYLYLPDLVNEVCLPFVLIQSLAISLPKKKETVDKVFWILRVFVSFLYFYFP